MGLRFLREPDAGSAGIVVDVYVYINIRVEEGDVVVGGSKCGNGDWVGIETWTHHSASVMQSTDS